MSNVRLIGCLHFGDKNIAKYRGFDDEYNHDEHLVDCWNKTVHKKDLTYILGDITMEKSNDYYQLDRLAGRKLVVLGNHDRWQDVKLLLNYVDGVAGMIDYKGFALTHAPIHVSEIGQYKGNVHCVDKETEILTHDGWKFYNEILKGDVIYSLNNNGFLEDDYINELIINSNYTGELVEIKDRQTHLIYTDKHRVLYKSKLNSKRFKYMPAKDFIKKKNVVFKCSGIYKNQKGIDLTDNMLKLLICLAADGNITDKKLCRLNVKKHRKFIYFQEILNNLCVDYNIRSNKSAKYCLSFRLPEELNNYIIKGLDKKLLKCNKNQCKLILEAYRNTDGCLNGNSTVLYTSKKSEFDILTHLFAINGFKCATHDRIGGFPNSGINYSISVLEQENIIKTKLDIKSRIYRDNILVWCVMTNNTNFISRRNGETYITGNCHIHHQNKLADLEVNESYNDRDTPIISTKGKYFNVDAKLIDYKPKTIEELLKNRND